MSISRVFFSDLKSGKCSSVVEARLPTVLGGEGVKSGGELMWVDMLLMGVNSTLIQATINANRLPRFRDRLAAGTMYSVSGFDVARCAQNFKLADSSLMIRFNDSTEFDVLSDLVSPIPAEEFRFPTELSDLNIEPVDIIGEIVAVKSTVSDPPEDKNRFMVTVKLENDVSVTLSLFDAQAVSFHQKLGGMRDDPKVIVTTSINPKMVGGRLFLNATSGTHVYYDKETHAGESLFYRLVARDTGLPSAAPLLKSYAKVEPVTIAELNHFITTDPPQQQEIDFLCTARVSRVEADKGWCYVACSKCSKKLQRTVTSFECARCNNPHAVGSLRYRVEMVVTDDTAEGTFVCFDGVMTKLHNLRASEAVQLLGEEGVNPEDSVMPPFVAGMEGKTYTFQVRVTPYNFTVNHQTFTVSRIINEVERAPAPEFVDDGTIMVASISAKRLIIFRSRLIAGAVYSVSGFFVAECAPTLRLTDSPLMIMFNDLTSFDMLSVMGLELPVEGFRFRNEAELLGLANASTELPDIVAELSAVKSTVNDPPKGKNHVMATIKMDKGGSVILSLFDCQAIAFHRRLDSMRVDPKVVVATNVKPRKIGGHLFLYATSGTHIYFDKDTSTGQACLSRLVNRCTGHTPVAPLIRKVTKVEPVTMAELNSFVAAAVSDDIEYMCTGTVLRLDSEKGWCYIACVKCGRKLKRTDSVFVCMHCENYHAVGVPRYRVELAIADDTDEGIFVCYDGTMAKLHGLEAYEAGLITAKNGVNPEDSQVPPFVIDMQGKTYTFHVKLATYDFTAGRQRFSVTRIINMNERLPLPEFVDHGGDESIGGSMGVNHQIHADVDYDMVSGEASLISATELSDPASLAVKKARNT
ncbi:unnamed protein product [Brassica napus]|uniref:(rape) hypothetical protein n=2 Tax=Brassica napus TaxID=3708 RepID=A0A816IJJ2_BRANA|nr:unnamed protein product [Brassica napus]